MTSNKERSWFADHADNCCCTIYEDYEWADYVLGQVEVASAERMAFHLREWPFI